MSATFELNCPHCDRLYTLSLERAVSLASRSIRCKDCGQAFRLPTEQEIRGAAEEPTTAEEVSTDATGSRPERVSAVVGVEPQPKYAAPEAPTTVGLREDAAALATDDPPEPIAPSVAPSVALSVPPPDATPAMPTVTASVTAPRVSDAPPQVIYAMPAQTVSDIAVVRRWVVMLGVVGLCLVTVNVVMLILALVRSR